MSVINLLSSKIYNRIAAGEVVERPYSVVKELVENSIDAGAKNITIEITNGGKSSIRVFDDGSGIEREQLKKALMPHATSKISKIDDLDDISTLGFRGEALASIASVSKITVTSKPETQQVGASISADGGTIGEIIDQPSPNGTEIIVRNLFYNTPAREKFLKSDRSEEGDITGIITRFILGNPEIAIKYLSNGKTIYQSFGDGFESAMITVYGNAILNDCFYIDTEKNGIKITGYIGKQYFSKPNRTYQSAFMNGRYIINQTISAAISNAYSSYVMKRQYPFYVISITLPPEAVDVNVHPNKTDVRFSDNRIVYGAVYSVVSKVLDGTGEALNIIIEKNQENIKETNYDYVRHNTNTNNVDKPYIRTEAKALPFEDFSYDKLVFCDSGKKQNIEDSENKNVDIFAENKAYLESLEKKEEKPITLEIRQTQQCMDIENDLKYVGQVLNTFLVFEDGVDLYLADQHAAHERILYDKFNKQLSDKNIEIQPLLVPYIKTLNTAEHSFILDKVSSFAELGIEIVDFGNESVKISAIPTCLLNIDFNSFLNDLLSDLNSLKFITINDILKDKIAQKACKAAIKSGDKLSNLEIEILTKEIKNNLGLKCPHGRPVVVKITRTEIDKWFKRIV